MDEIRLYKNGLKYNLKHSGYPPCQHDNSGPYFHKDFPKGMDIIDFHKEMYSYMSHHGHVRYKFFEEVIVSIPTGTKLELIDTVQINSMIIRKYLFNNKELYDVRMIRPEILI